jgi:undecaprenyl-diphosphatase
MKIRALEGVRVDRTQIHASTRWVRRRHDVIALAGGLVVLGTGMIAVRNGSVSGFEKSVFHAINDLPQAFYPVLWPVQQLGAILVGPIVAAAAALSRRFRLAVALLIATVAKLLLERAVKAIVSRERPGTSIGPDIHLRGTVSLTGESFVSGHAVLVTAIAGLVSPYLRGRWKIIPWALVILAMVARVYVGAHNPLDVICGAALGLAIASALSLAVGVPETE